MKYKVGQRVHFMSQSWELLQGEIILVESDDYVLPYLIQGDGNYWVSENQIVFANTYAENERLRAVIANVRRVATGLYECAPTEGVTELLFYLSVMQREFDLALAESEE